MGSRSTAKDAPSLQPQRAIRRFDIFAEYNRLKGLDKGMDEAHAKGYGLWLAKVVASGGGRRAKSQHEKPTGPQEGGERQEESRQTPAKQEWHELDGEPQTGALFDREIIRRMGSDFYMQVFAPAVAEAMSQGRSYEGIRDTLRKGWTPTRP
ncbi:MAG TPA: hypothetical protein VFW17_07795 [Ktedonobacterales bacterium]|jgi:hypothetical protein|nr:hypothetical protein [Ktedonobacterales bacterium]